MPIKFRVKNDLKTDQLNGIVDSGMVEKEVAKQCETLPALVKAYIDSLDTFNNIVFVKDTIYNFDTKANFEMIKERFEITEDQYTVLPLNEVIGTGENGEFIENKLRQSDLPNTNFSIVSSVYSYNQNNSFADVYGDNVVVSRNGDWKGNDIGNLNVTGKQFTVYLNGNVEQTSHQSSYRQYYFVKFHEDITVVGIARAAGTGGKTYAGTSSVVIDNGTDTISLATTFTDKVNASALQSDLDTTNTNLTVLTSKVDSDEAQINFIRELANDNSANITTNTNSIQTLNAQITTISSDLTNVENKQLEHSTTLETHSNDITDLKAKNTSLNASVLDLEEHKVSEETFNLEMDTQKRKNQEQDSVINRLVNDLDNWRPNEYLGEYDTKTKYKRNQTCSSGNDLYLSKVDNNKGNDLKDPNYWLLTNYSVSVNLDGYATLVYTDNEIKKLNTKITDNTTQIGTFNKKVADMRVQIQEAMDSVDAQHADLELVKTEISGYQAQIDTKADRSTTVREIELLKASVEAKQNKITPADTLTYLKWDMGNDVTIYKYGSDTLSINYNNKLVLADIDNNKINITKGKIENHYNSTEVDNLINPLSEKVVKLDNPTYDTTTEYLAYKLPNGKQVYKKYFDLNYTQQDKVYDYDFNVIPSNYRMRHIEGTGCYVDSGNVYSINSNISSSSFLSVRKYLDKYIFKWYVVDTGKTINLSGFVYYTKD